MLEWEGFFKPHILKRGWCYAEDGAVQHLRQNGDEIEAIVVGSEYYKVRIRYDGHMVSDACCSCPYAASGEWCKHMAAVLYEVDRGNGSTAFEADFSDTEQEEGSSISVVQMIREADRERLEKILVEMACEDVKTESRIRSMLAGTHKTVDSSKPGKLKKDIDTVFDIYADRSGYINYYNAMEFARDLEVYLENETARLLDEQEYLPAFELTIYAFTRLGECDIDDDGEIMQISHICYEIWKEIIFGCPPKVKEYIREWFVRHSEDGTVPDFMEDVLRDFLKYELASREELEEQLKELDQLIEASEGSVKCKTVFTSHYGFSIEAIELRMILMQKLGASENEIDRFRRSHMHFESVRRYYLEKAKEEGDTEEEIRLLKESKTLDAGSSWLVHSYAERLIKLYHKRGEFVSEKKECKEAFMAYQGSTLEDFRKYRDMCTDEEWESEKITLIESREDQDMKCRLLAEEKMITDLYKLIGINGFQLPYLNKYGFLLANEYSEQVLNVYEKHVIQLADLARNRAAYSELARYLMRMREYTGGEELVRSLCGGWIEKYPTRKVMVEELRRFL